MKPHPLFLEVEHVKAIHQRSIELFGGSLGLREPGLLSSAVAMPKATFGGVFLHKGIPAMAAAYLFHLCKNHAFVDGNKRVALATAEVMLDWNGYRLAATDVQLETLTLGVADSSIGKEALTEFLAKHTRKVRVRGRTI